MATIPSMVELQDVKLRFDTMNYEKRKIKDLSDLNVVLSVIYVDLSDHCFDLSEKKIIPTA